MKLIYFKALFSIYGLVLLSSFLQSCCKEEGKFTGDGYITVFQGEHPHQDLDSVSGSFFLKVHFTSMIEQVSFYEISLINSVYATSCGYKQLNTLDETTFRLNVKPSITYLGDSIDSNYNLFEINAIDTNMHFHGDHFNINFTQEFLNNSTLRDTLYKFTFIGNTSDDIPIKLEKKLWIE